MQVEWTAANEIGEVSDSLLEGLNRRAFRLLKADSIEWLEWLDNDKFWNPGWKGEVSE